MNVTFKEAYEALKNGAKIKRAHWAGYWVKEDENVSMYCKDGKVVKIGDSPDIFFTITNMLQDDWVILDGEKPIEVINTFTFGEALRKLKQGFCIAREGWNGKGMFVVKQIPAHIGEDVIPKMQSLPESAKELLLSKEYPKYIDYTSQMIIVNKDGRADSWVPSSSDCFAEDWFVKN